MIWLLQSLVTSIMTTILILFLIKIGMMPFYAIFVREEKKGRIVREGKVAKIAKSVEKN